MNRTARTPKALLALGCALLFLLTAPRYTWAKKVDTRQVVEEVVRENVQATGATRWWGWAPGSRATIATP